jgi:type IV secretion system protein VirB10
MTNSAPDNIVAPEPLPHPSGPDSGRGGSGEPPERGMPDLNQRHRRGGRWVTPLLIAVVAVVGAVWTVHGLVARHDASAKARRDSAADQPVQGRRFDDALPTSSPVAPTAPSAMPASPPIAVMPAPAAPRASSMPVRTYYDAPLMALAQPDGGAVASMQGAMPASSASGAPVRPANMASATGQTESPLAEVLTPTATPRVTATRLGNRNFILAQGAKIDCAGDTAFDSTEAGISTCTVTKNVYSDNGQVVLIERGSQVNSEYRANVAQGQRRVFILSARVKTPNGVIVAIDSPAADALGRMGIGGYVDNHWGERVGAAFLLGLVQDSIGYLATRGGNANGSIEFENTEQTGNDMASRVLDSTINIAPTLKQNQGAEFTIVVARDLDFSSVYALQPE